MLERRIKTDLAFILLVGLIGVIILLYAGYAELSLKEKCLKLGYTRYEQPNYCIKTHDGTEYILELE